MKLLLIEDNTALCESLSFLLKFRGFDVDICNDGSSGLKIISRYDYSIIILEQFLPMIKGMDLLKKLRALEISVPVLMITENEELEINFKKTDSYMTKYIMKPFNIDKLYGYVDELLYPPGSGEELLSKQKERKLFFSDITLFPVKRLLVGKGNYCTTLSKREAKIMEMFINAPSKTVSAHTLWEKAWNNDDRMEIERIEQYITFLKRRLKKVSSSLDLTKTDGIKYRLGKQDE